MEQRCTGETYTYGDSDWKDLLTAYSGHPITYDAIGNHTVWYVGSTAGDAGFGQIKQHKQGRPPFAIRRRGVCHFLRKARGRKKRSASCVSGAGRP